MKTQVSIILSVYNGETYLKEAIESILAQTYGDFEFVIINDCSTDSSLSIIESYSDPRINLVNNEVNKGLVASLNYGLQIAQGEYIARQDDDDRSHPERLEHQVEFLEKNSSYGMVGTNYRIIDGKGKEISRSDLPLDNETLQRELAHQSPFCHGSVMIRKHILRKVGGYREKIRYAEDYDLWLRIAEECRVVNLEDALYFLRRGISSLSSDKLMEQINSHLLAFALGRERKQRGHDSLQKLDISCIEELLLNRYGFSKNEIKKFKNEQFHDWYYKTLRLGARRQALAIWFKLFTYDPQKWKIRKLVNDLIKHR